MNTDQALLSAVKAYWNAVPMHVDYDEYISKHEYGKEIEETMKMNMSYAILAYLTKVGNQ